MYQCLSSETCSEDFADRSAIFEDDYGFGVSEDAPESMGQPARSLNEPSSKAEVAIRRSFPESWIFDGNLEMGYTKQFLFLGTGKMPENLLMQETSLVFVAFILICCMHL